LTIYGVKNVEHENAAGFKISKMVLTDGKVIAYPTMADIRENNLLTYHSSKALNDNLVFSKSMLY
jgi:SET domain-containing protein